jgi:hypothetical protein
MSRAFWGRANGASDGDLREFSRLCYDWNYLLFNFNVLQLPQRDIMSRNEFL